MFEPLKKEAKETQKEFKERTATLILAGFGLVAALAWNEAIRSFFEAYLPKSGELLGKFLYALLITLIVVIVSRYLGKNLPKERVNKCLSRLGHLSPISHPGGVFNFSYS